jgi:hypothetical protein
MRLFGATAERRMKKQLSRFKLGVGMVPSRRAALLGIRALKFE